VFCFGLPELKSTAVNIWGSVNYYVGCGSGSDICKSRELVICVIYEKEVLTYRGCMAGAFRLMIALAFVSRKTLTQMLYISISVSVSRELTGLFNRHVVFPER